MPGTIWPDLKRREMVYSALFRSRTRLSDLVGRCGVTLVRRGREFVALCPFHHERTPSFTVVDDKRFFHCFGCGAHGDVFAFVMLVENIDFRTAVASIAGRLGADMPEAPGIDAVSKIDQLSDREARNRELAWRLWSAAGDPRGTPVENYLHTRGLGLPSMPVLRWAPRCWNRETGRELPAMLARVDGPDNKFAAVHRTWLLQGGSGKAALRNPKMLLGPTRGAAVRLEPAAPVLAVAEGIETALTATAAGYAAWSALSAGGIRSVVLPPIVKEVLIVGDHDLNGVGQRAARQAADRRLAEGRRVRLWVPPRAGEDLNNILIRFAGGTP
jgi:phage/plasmid primase-like uncharacterized protein